MLRFDFTQPKAIPREQLTQIENEVNARVAEGAPVTWEVMELEQAKKTGATALFGEKYPDRVRVVTMGSFSRELCGGTHLSNTGQVGLCKIIGEESVAAGTRRITALVGKAALDYVRQEEEILATLAASLRVPAGQVTDRVNSLLEELKTLKKQVSQRRPEADSRVTAEDLLAAARDIAGATVVIQSLDNVTPDSMRQLVDVMRRKHENRCSIRSLAVGIQTIIQQRGKFACRSKQCRSGPWSAFDFGGARLRTF